MFLKAFWETGFSSIRLTLLEPWYTSIPQQLNWKQCFEEMRAWWKQMSKATKSSPFSVKRFTFRIYTFLFYIRNPFIRKLILVPLKIKKLLELKFFCLFVNFLYKKKQSWMTWMGHISRVSTYPIIFVGVLLYWTIQIFSFYFSKSPLSGPRK